MLIPNRYPFERVLKTELMRRTSRGKTEGSEVQGAASGSPKVLKVLRLVGHSCPPPLQIMCGSETDYPSFVPICDMSDELHRCINSGGMMEFPIFPRIVRVMIRIRTGHGTYLETVI